MIIAAVDVDATLKNNKLFILRILSSLPLPFRLIIWGSHVVEDILWTTPLPHDLKYTSTRFSKPQCLLHALPTNVSTELYVFTRGHFDGRDMYECHRLVQQKPLPLSRVHLYYVGEECQIRNLDFVHVFRGVPVTLCVSQRRVSHFDALYPDFASLPCEAVDDTFHVTVLHHRQGALVDRMRLLSDLCRLQSRVLRDSFRDCFSIQPFYETRDVEGCVAYLQKRPYYASRVRFQKRMVDLFNLCHLSWPETNYCMTSEEYVTCIPVQDFYFPHKKYYPLHTDPFLLLSAEKEVIDALMNQVGSICSRKGCLQGLYVLHRDCIDVTALIEHNSQVLKPIFYCTEPIPVLRHMAFLYLLAQYKFPEARDTLLAEIRYLGEHTMHYVTLKPLLYPPIVENVNCCLWYIAQVCPKAFPNSPNNILRNRFIAGEFINFYQEVYEENYAPPRDFYLWQLWFILTKRRSNIFQILSFFFEHTVLYGGIFFKETYPYSIILHPEIKIQNPPKERTFLSKLDLRTILKVYCEFKNTKQPKFYNKDLNSLRDVGPLDLYNDPLYNAPSLLHHVQINPKTCHPFIYCKITGKHWKECAGKYNPDRQSYLRLFKNYCEKKGCYPTNGVILCIFLNKRLFKRNNHIPVLLPKDILDQMNDVIRIFHPIITMYECEDYIRISNEMASEQIRLQYENFEMGTHP